MSTKKLFNEKAKFGATMKEWADAFFRMFSRLRNEKMETSKCLRCGRTLKNQKSIERGYGEYCYKKIQQRKTAKPLFEIKKERGKENGV